MGRSVGTEVLPVTLARKVNQTPLTRNASGETDVEHLEQKKAAPIYAPFFIQGRMDSVQRMHTFKPVHAEVLDMPNTLRETCSIRPFQVYGAW